MPRSRVTDDPLEFLQQKAAVPVEPRPEFAAALFARLERELAQPARRRVLVPLMPRPGLRVSPWVVAAVVALVATSVLIARPTTVSAAQVVQRAAQELATLPQVRATVHYDLAPDGSSPNAAPGATADVLVTYVRGLGYRQEIVATSGRILGIGGVGSVVVWDGTQLGSSWSDTRSFTVSAPTSGYEPLRELAWNTPYPGWDQICERGGSQILDDALIAGRAAHHVRCGDLYGGFWDLWTDTETGFMLKIKGALAQDDFRLGSGPKGGFEVTAIEFAFPIDHALFAVVPPSGAVIRPPVLVPDAKAPAADPYSQTSLRKGEVAPLWSGPLFDGTRFSPSDARGRPLLLLMWADWCPRGDPSCDVLRQYDQVSREYAGRAAFVSVDVGRKADEARKILAAQGYEFRVVVEEEDAQIDRAWGIQVVPTWVLLDRDGRVVEVRLGVQTVEQLHGLLAGAGL
jgi:thiol-disulfide isomerase/thioredoxin